MKRGASVTPHVAAAEKYAADVVAGRIQACEYVRAACRRHINDRKAEKLAPFLYRFDAAKAERKCKFIELLPHTKGEWARLKPGDPAGNSIRLEPWQSWIVCSIFGWVHKATGMRRFREVYIEVPRKNGKSLLAAGIGLALFADDDEMGAEVYSGATTEKQAWEVFKPALLMARARPALRAHYGIECNASNINIIANGSKFEPLIGKPGDGASPSCAVIDEFHEHQTPDQYDTMLTGMGARRQPLMFIITTAGDNLAGPCYDKRLSIIRILTGAASDEEKFGIIYTVDSGVDWTTIDALRMANPNIGVSVSEEFLRSRQKEGIENSRRQGVFKTKHLNLWVQSRSAYFNMERWAACYDPTLRLEDFEGQRCIASLDLASKVDIAALELLFPLDDGGFACFRKLYLPEETVASSGNDHYRGWAADGKLIVTDGSMIDFDRIEEDVIEIARRFDLQEVAYDPFQATMLVTHLMSAGIPVIEYRQTVQGMSDPMKTLDGLIGAKKLRHNCPANDPMTWMMSNVTARTDQKDNVYPNKDRPENKIDGPIALIMALGRAIMEDGGSIYDTAERPDGMLAI